MSRNTAPVRVLNRGWFRRGHDPRRHLLTTEERRRGGLTAWFGVMALVRVEMHLALPLPEIQAAAEKLLAERRAQIERVRKERGL